MHGWGSRGRGFIRHAEELSPGRVGQCPIWEQNGAGDARLGGLRRGDRDPTQAIDLGGRRYLFCFQASGLSRVGGRASSSPAKRLSTAKLAMARRVSTVADPRCGMSTALSHVSRPG